MGTKRKIENCTSTFDVCEILARAIRKMPEYKDCIIDTYGPFGVSCESSVFVERRIAVEGVEHIFEGDVVGMIHIHHSEDSESGFSYGKSLEVSSFGEKVNYTKEKPLPKDIARAVERVFENNAVKDELSSVVEGLSDEDCIALYNEITAVGTHKVYRTSGMNTRAITDAEGEKVMPSISLAFDNCAPYYVVDTKNPDEPFYCAEYELRSVYHFDEIYNSPYEKVRLTPREMLTSNLVTLGYADRVREMAHNS